MAKFISNKEKQRQLDEAKWLESQNFGQDMSGKMEWCIYCPYCDISNCKASPDQRYITKNCLCAKAYNKMIRRFC